MHLITSKQDLLVFGMHIEDNIYLAQEIMHSIQKAPKSKALMTIKVDLEGAYDRFNEAADMRF